MDFCEKDPGPHCAISLTETQRRSDTVRSIVNSAVPHDGDGVALLILCMMAGGVVGPAIESVMVSAFGIRVVPIVLCGFALACLGVFSSALRFSPRRSSVAGGELA
jgi:hypothetical protein